MKTKTFKIGEYCKGGIITVEIKGNTIAVIAKEWDHSQGTRRGSDQKNAKEWDRLTVEADVDGVERKLLDYLCDLTTSYYADQVLEFIKSKVTLNKSFW